MSGYNDVGGEEARALTARRNLQPDAGPCANCHAEAACCLNVHISKPPLHRTLNNGNDVSTLLCGDSVHKFETRRTPDYTHASLRSVVHVNACQNLSYEEYIGTHERKRTLLKIIYTGYCESESHAVAAASE